jgi:hypothetical protein
VAASSGTPVARPVKAPVRRKSRETFRWDRRMGSPREVEATSSGVGSSTVAVTLLSAETLKRRSCGELAPYERLDADSGSGSAGRTLASVPSTS